jgi:hypothetical protein
MVYTLVEPLTIPVSVVNQAMSMGLSTFSYQRTFSPAGRAGTQCVTIHPASAGSASFNISREALSFDNGAPVRVLERKQPLRANAELTFNGSGMMEGQWEVANPVSTAGQPIFRPLALARQSLVGSETKTVTSPALPTDIAGLYLVRLRITDPATAFETPVIRYFVTDPQTPAVRPPVPMGLVTPPNQVLLTGDTAFAWDVIPGARAYQLEIYAKPRTAGDSLPDLGGSSSTALVLPPTPPVAGMMVAGARTRTTLSEAARARLISGQNYLWRVLAIGNDGSVIGESSVREVRMP